MSLSFNSSHCRSQTLTHLFPESGSPQAAELRGFGFFKGLMALTAGWFIQKIATTGGSFYADEERKITTYPSIIVRQTHQTNVEGVGLVTTTDETRVRDLKRKQINNEIRYFQLEDIGSKASEIGFKICRFPGILAALSISVFRKHVTSSAFTLARFRQFDPIATTRRGQVADPSAQERYRESCDRQHTLLGRISLWARLAIVPISLVNRILSLGFALYFSAASVVKLAEVVFYGIKKACVTNPETKRIVAEKLFVHSSQLRAVGLLALAHFVGIVYLDLKDYLVLRLADEFSNRSLIGSQIDRAQFIPEREAQDGDIVVIH